MDSLKKSWERSESDYIQEIERLNNEISEYDDQWNSWNGWEGWEAHRAPNVNMAADDDESDHEDSGRDIEREFDHDWSNLGGLPAEERMIELEKTCTGAEALWGGERSLKGLGEPIQEPGSGKRDLKGSGDPIQEHRRHIEGYTSDRYQLIAGAIRRRRERTNDGLQAHRRLSPGWRKR